MRGEGVKTYSSLCRTEPSARGVAPATDDAARPATGGRAARPKDPTAQADGRNVGCESPKHRTVNCPPSSFSHSGTATGGSPRTSANALRSVSQPDRGSGPWRRRPSTSTPSSRIRFQRSRTPRFEHRPQGVAVGLLFPPRRAVTRRPASDGDGSDAVLSHAEQGCSA